ncbi:YqaE/Pmp3 family membrane protein [Thalassobacillus sp. CUG 92003]|uniref:YqaE/Pmp3 family membrane protein n=1 Tax=Thalassobacillus sp. CUG 92003 TaxID=2736641 RepID=UPI0015E65DDD
MLYIFAILLPPLAVLFTGKPLKALVNFFLTLLFYVPGAVHAAVVVKEHYDGKKGRYR